MCKNIQLRLTYSSLYIFFFRKMPTLNICVQRRGLSLWYRRMKKTIIDFDLVQGEAMTVFRRLQSAQYNMRKGPLWKVRMVQLSPHETSPRGVTAKYQTMIVFGIHHCVTDAQTNMKICKEFLNVLNDIKQGRQISCKSYPFIEQNFDNHTHSTFFYQCAYVWKKVFRVLIFDFEKVTTFSGLMSFPRNISQEMKEVHHVFAEDITCKFLKRCRDYKVSVHSAIVTAVNISFLDILRRKSRDPVEEIQIYYVDAFDLRRYYSKERDAVGCHISMYEHNLFVTSHTRENFWECARLAKVNLHHKLNSKKALKLIPIMKYESLLYFINSAKNRRKKNNVTDSHYVTTNLGDLSKFLGETNPNDPYQLSDLFRTVSGELMGHLFTLTCQTFQNRLYLAYDYGANKLSDSHSRNLLNATIGIINILAEKGAVI